MVAGRYYWDYLGLTEGFNELNRHWNGVNTADRFVYLEEESDAVMFRLTWLPGDS